MNGQKSYKLIKSIQLAPAIDPSTPMTVYIRVAGIASAITANCLDIKIDEHGNIGYLLLDRLIHNTGDTGFELSKPDLQSIYYSVRGCYVSELFKIDII